MKKIVYENMFSSIWFYLALSGILSMLLFGVLPHVISRSEILTCHYEQNDAAMVCQIEKLTEQKIIMSQPVSANYDNIKAIGVQFETNGEIQEGEIALEFWDLSEQRKLSEANQDILYIREGEVTYFSFPKSISISKEHQFEIRIYKIGEKNLVTETEDLYYSVKGYPNGCQNKLLFLVVLFFLVTTIMLLVYWGIRSPEFTDVVKMEWVLLFVGIFSCCLIYNQGFDMSLTIEHAKDLLSVAKKGDFFHFYDVVLKKALYGGYLGNGVKDAAYYNLFYYVILAIVILPCVVFGKVTGIYLQDTAMVLYLNVFLSAALLYSAYLLKKLAVVCGMKEQRGVLVSFVYLSSVTTLFATVGFSQLDIVYIILLLLSLLFYGKRKYINFCLLISLSIMLKYFPALIFIPLILVVEKRVLHIAKYILLGMSSSLVYSLVFGRSIGYQYTKTEMTQLYGFVDRVFRSGIDVGIGKCAFFVLLFVLLCIWCYDRGKEDERWKFVVSVPLIVIGGFYIFLLWHPEWLVLIMPFIALALVLLPNRKSLIYCEWIWGVAACLLSWYFFPDNVDNTMINRGILPLVTGHQYQGVKIVDIMGEVDYSFIVVATIFVAVLLYFVINACRDVMSMKTIGEYETETLKREVVLLRLATMLGICVLFVVMFFLLG